MLKLLNLAVSTLLLVTVVFSAHAAQDRSAVVERVRAELATVLKKEAAKLPVDKSVTELGASELHVVEWIMGVERAFRIRIRDEDIADPNTKKTRSDVSIAYVAKLVSERLENGKGKR